MRLDHLLSKEQLALVANVYKCPEPYPKRCVAHNTSSGGELVSGALVIRSGQLPGLVSTTACGMESQILRIAQVEHAVGS